MDDDSDDPWQVASDSPSSDPWACDSAHDLGASPRDSPDIADDADGGAVGSVGAIVAREGLAQQPPQPVEALVVAQAQPQQPHREKTSRPTVALALFVRHVGRLVHRETSRAFQQAQDAAVPDKLARAFEHYVGAEARGALSLVAERRILNISRKDAHDMPITIAAVSHLANRSFAASLCSHILRLAESGSLRLVSCGTSSSYDETPLPFAMPVAHQGKEHSFWEDTTDDSVAEWKRKPIGLLQSSKAKQTCKILQSSHQLGFLVYNNTKEEFLAILVPLNAPLSVADSCTGEVLVQFLREQLHVPLMTAAAEKFGFVFRSSTSDRAKTNFKAERAFTTSLHVSCDLHIASNVQGRQYEPIQSTISGLLAAALAQKPWGALGKLREALSFVLLQRLVIIAGPPPCADDPRTLHRARLLDLFLPRTCRGDARRLQLATLMNGDWTSATIHWHTEEANPDRNRWAALLVDALVPTAWPVFPRARWLLSHAAINEAGLLACCHRLLEQVLPAWVAMLKNPMARVPPPLADPESDDETVIKDDDDDTASEEQEVGQQQHQQQQQQPRRRHQQQQQQQQQKQRPQASGDRQEKMDWAEFNERQRGNALTWALTRPGAILLTARVCLAPLVTLFQQLLFRSGEDFDEASLLAAVRSGELPMRISTAAWSTYTLKFFKKVFELLSTHQPWCAMPSRWRTCCYQVLAFSMLARAAAGIHRLMYLPQRGFPFRLWRTVDQAHGQAEAEKVAQAPDCLHDRWTKTILQKWPTSTELRSADCQATLLMVGIMTAMDIGQIECRHASVRRIMRAKSQTHGLEFARGSADFFLLRQHNSLQGRPGEPAPWSLGPSHT